MRYWNGNLITSTESEPTSSSASGIFDLTSQLIYKSASKWPGPPSGLVTANLALHLDARNTNSYGGTGTTWADLTSNSNNVTLVNGPTFSQNAITFDGTNDYATLSSTITFTDHTVEVWIFHTSPNATGDYGYITTNATHGLAVSEGGTLFSLSDGALYYNNGGTAVLLNATLSSDEWTHLVAVGDSSTNSLKIYLNGSLTSTTSVTSLATSITRLAYFQGTGSLNLNAKLAQIRIYDDQLTAAEVLQNYNATKDTFGVVTTNLVLHLDAGDANSYSGSGTAWNDLSGNGNHGTLTNSPTYDSANGGSIVLDGTNDHVTFSTSSDFTFGTGDFTIELNVRPDTVVSTYIGLASSNEFVNNTGNGVGFGTDASGYLTHVISDITSFSTNSTAVKWSANSRQQIVITRENGYVKIFVNKVQVGTTKSSSNNATGDDFVVGMYYPNYLGYYFDGKIYDVKVYKGKALTIAEITQNYDALSGRF